MGGGEEVSTNDQYCVTSLMDETDAIKVKQHLFQITRMLFSLKSIISEFYSIIHFTCIYEKSKTVKKVVLKCWSNIKMTSVGETMYLYKKCI